jgi:hypothetical protein
MFTTFRSEPSNHWSAPTEVEQEQKLHSLGLAFDKLERVILCTICKYALKPGSRTVSKHPGECHSVPAGARKGLDALIQSLNVSDPERLKPRIDGCTPHPHLAIQIGCACSICEYKTTSLEPMGRHFSKTDAAGEKGKKWVNSITLRMTFRSEEKSMVYVIIIDLVTISNATVCYLYCALSANEGACRTPLQPSRK